MRRRAKGQRDGRHSGKHRETLDWKPRETDVWLGLRDKKYARWGTPEVTRRRANVQRDDMHDGKHIET